jgi:hypothetical protein
MAGSKDLKSELVKLAAGLSRAELQESWRQHYGSDPPEQISRQLLTVAIAHRMQVKARGGLSFPARRALERASEEFGSNRGTNSYKPSAAGGIVLVRVWHGVSHQVTTLKDSVEYRGQRYRSLSEVARKITGARWSGPRFFGLRSPEEDRAVR